MIADTADTIDITLMRVVSPAYCPFCEHDNRNKDRKCVHFQKRADSVLSEVQPIAGFSHTVAQSYINQEKLVNRVWVYAE